MRCCRKPACSAPHSLLSIAQAAGCTPPAAVLQRQVDQPAAHVPVRVELLADQCRAACARGTVSAPAITQLHASHSAHLWRRTASTPAGEGSRCRGPALTSCSLRRIHAQREAGRVCCLQAVCAYVHSATTGSLCWPLQAGQYSQTLRAHSQGSRAKPARYSAHWKASVRPLCCAGEAAAKQLISSAHLPGLSCIYLLPVAALDWGQVQVAWRSHRRHVCCSGIATSCASAAPPHDRLISSALAALQQGTEHEGFAAWRASSASRTRAVQL